MKNEVNTNAPMDAATIFHVMPPGIAEKKRILSDQVIALKVIAIRIILFVLIWDQVWL
ncbi:hypothetical protein [Flaviaesturariibacter amylovorans]|uniref:hypothetical protein n=1 Tax=Flaviaesturariibacter amylovorans TaxID=1084520 RepID=UPI0031EDD75E